MPVLRFVAGTVFGIMSAAYDACGDLLVTADADGAVKLWNGHSGRLFDTLHHGTHGEGTAVALSADGRVLVTAMLTGVMLWDVASRKVVWAFSWVGTDPNLDCYFHRVEVTADGRYGLAEDAYGRPSLVFDVRARKVLRSAAHGATLTSDGRLLNPGPSVSQVIPLNGGALVSLPLTTPWALSADGRCLAGRHGTQTRLVTLGGRRLLDVALTPKSLVWDPHNPLLAIDSEEEVTIVDARTGHRCSHFQVDDPVSFLPGNIETNSRGKNMAGAKENSWIGRWVVSPAGDTFVGETSKVPSTHDSPSGIMPPPSLWGVHSGKRVASLGSDLPWVEGIAETHGAVLVALQGARWNVADPSPCFSGLALFDSGVTFVPTSLAEGLTVGGNLLATRDYPDVTLRDTHGRIVLRLPSPNATAHISPDGRYLGLDSALWDLRTLQRLPAHLPGSAWGFTAGGLLLCQGEEDDKLSVVSVPEGKVVRTLDSMGSVRSVDSSDAGRRYLLTADHYDASLYDLETGRRLAQPLTADSIASVALSGDEQMAAIGRNFSPILLWDVPSAREVGTLSEHTASVVALHFSQDGRRLYSGGVDGRLCIWDVPKRCLLGTVVVMGSKPDWVVYTPDGACDGTPAGIDRLEGHGPRLPGLLHTLLIP